MNSVTWAMVVSALEVMQVLVDLPVRDPRAMALDLEPLDRQERLDDLGPERVAQDRVGLERVERGLQRDGQLGAGLVPVGVADHGRGQLEPAAYAVVAG